MLFDHLCHGIADLAFVKIPGVIVVHFTIVGCQEGQEAQTEGVGDQQAVFRFAVVALGVGPGAGRAAQIHGVTVILPGIEIQEVDEFVLVGSGGAPPFQGELWHQQIQSVGSNAAVGTGIIPVVGTPEGFLHGQGEIFGVAGGFLTGTFGHLRIHQVRAVGIPVHICAEVHIFACLDGRGQDLRCVDGVHIVVAQTVYHIVPGGVEAYLVACVHKPVGPGALGHHGEHQFAVFGEQTGVLVQHGSHSGYIFTGTVAQSGIVAAGIHIYTHIGGVVRQAGGGLLLNGRVFLGLGGTGRCCSLTGRLGFSGLGTQIVQQIVQIALVNFRIQRIGGTLRDQQILVVGGKAEIALHFVGGGDHLASGGEAVQKVGLELLTELAAEHVAECDFGETGQGAVLIGGVFAAAGSKEDIVQPQNAEHQHPKERKNMRNYLFHIYAPFRNGSRGRDCSCVLPASRWPAGTSL